MTIRVLVVDDSVTYQRQLVQILESDPEVKVVGFAASGREALAAVQSLKPDVVTMDVMMPDGDGVSATELIMRTCPVPIVIVSGLEAGPTGVRALGAGAVDLVSKAVRGEDMPRMSAQLIRSVKLMSEVKVLRRWRRTATAETPIVQPPSSGAFPVVAIGASTGGPQLVCELIRSLAAKSFRHPLLVTQHISAGFERFMADWWTDATGVRVRIGADGERPGPGMVFLAPAKFHMELDERGALRCTPATAEEPHTPSVNRMMQSVARVCGTSALGVLLSGMGNDGARGMRALRDVGAKVAVQDPSTAVVDGMPKSALALTPDCAVLAPDAIAAWIVESFPRNDAGRTRGG